MEKRASFAAAGSVDVLRVSVNISEWSLGLAGTSECTAVSVPPSQ